MCNASHNVLTVSKRALQALLKRSIHHQWKSSSNSCPCCLTSTSPASSSRDLILHYILVIHSFVDPRGWTEHNGCCTRWIHQMAPIWDHDLLFEKETAIISPSRNIIWPWKCCTTPLQAIQWHSIPSDYIRLGCERAFNIWSNHR